MAYGQGATASLFALTDGSVRLNDRVLPGVFVEEGEPKQIIAILIGLLLPAVQRPVTTVQCLGSSEVGINYLLPYIEQESLYRSLR